MAQIAIPIPAGSEKQEIEIAITVNGQQLQVLYFIGEPTGAYIPIMFVHREEWAMHRKRMRDA